MALIFQGIKNTKKEIAESIGHDPREDLWNKLRHIEADIAELNGKIEAQIDELEDKNSGKKGIWFVFGYDGNPYPAFVSNNELEALRYIAKYNFYHIKFWEFGTEWNNDSRTPSSPTGSD